MRRKDEWSLTYTGKTYCPIDPRPEDVCIEDIAHGLSMLCRYNGQCREFYSVAEHSVHVSYMVPEALALEALLHDASEAYCNDLARPLKMHLPDYQLIEALNDAVIREVFALPASIHPLVAQADRDIVESEKCLLAPMPDGHTWGGTLDPSVRIYAWSPARAEYAFLRRFHTLSWRN
jgi:hypothetical protein